jgi:NAD(P)-dependent dehydrogenase (short-subunit alcohol dehydrogenase family)
VSERYSRLDALLLNAGLFLRPYARTSDGFEATVGVNHIGHFVLTYAPPRLTSTSPHLTQANLT